MEQKNSQLDTLTNGKDSLKLLCAHPASDVSRKTLIQYFENTKTQLLAERLLLSHKQSKKAALNVVGNVSRGFFFGVLHADYAKEMSRTINRIKRRIFIEDAQK